MPSAASPPPDPGRSGWLIGLGLCLLVACGAATVESPEAKAEAGSAASDAPGPSPSAESAPVAARPGPAEDVVLVTVDTLRADAVGFGGAGPGVTPVLDRLAAGGAVFSHAHAHNVVTLPSHANILTGQLPYEHGIRDNLGFRLDASIPTLATWLQAEGFATAAVVGAFVLDARFGLDRGFDLYDDELPESAAAAGFAGTARRGDEVVRRGLEWWRENTGRRRFLWLHLFDPHAPYAPPPELAARFPGDPYRGEVAAVDSYLAPLLEPLLAGEGPPVLVVFTSDHGEALGDHGEMTHGLFAYEPTLRVPLVVWGAGVEPGRRAALARHVDLAPTILAAAGVARPPGLSGHTLLEAENGEDVVTYFEALTATLDRGWAPLRGVIGGGHKLISLPLPELYDLDADPAEENNLFGAQRDQARRLAAKLPAESVWPPRRGAVSGETLRSLRTLGYLGGDAPARTAWGPEDDPKRLVHLDREMHRVIDLYQRRRFAEAAEAGRAVVAKRPDMGIAQYYLAQVLLEDGRPREALEVMARAYRSGATTPGLVRQLGLSLADAGDFPRALEVLRPPAESGDPDALNALGLVLSEAGSQAEARRVLERVFATDARNATAHQHLALVASRTGDWATARREAERALARVEGLDQAWNYLGAARFNLGDPAGAVTAWKRSVELEPANFDALYNLALVAADLGDVDTARRALSRFIAEAPPARYGPDVATARRRLASLGG